MDKNKIPDFLGTCTINTSLHLEELSTIVSSKLLGGLPFTYGKHSIWEEIPSMYIEHSILGLLVIIGGYGGEDGYSIEISLYGNYSRFLSFSNIDTERISLDKYLYFLLKDALINHPEIKIVEPI